MLGRHCRTLLYHVLTGLKVSSLGNTRAVKPVGRGTLRHLNQHDGSQVKTSPRGNGFLALVPASPNFKPSDAGRAMCPHGRFSMQTSTAALPRMSHKRTGPTNIGGLYADCTKSQAPRADSVRASGSAQGPRSSKSRHGRGTLMTHRIASLPEHFEAVQGCYYNLGHYATINAVSSQVRLSSQIVGFVLNQKIV